MTPRWDDLETVLHLVREGSLARAAEQLGVTYTTVARRIVRAETALGVTLFERLSDGYRPTEAAALVAGHAATMQDAAFAMLREMAGRDGSLTGPLIVTAPQLLIAHLLAPAISAFGAAHPGVELRMRATNDLLDLGRREADLAIRVSRAPGDTLKGQRLAAQDMASFATPDWAARIEREPRGTIDWIIFTPQDSLPGGVTQLHPGARIRYRFDDMVAIAGAVQAGLGVARLPMFLGRNLPGLVQLPVPAPQSYADIWMVAHADVWPSARVAAFREVLKSFFRSNRALFVA